MILITQLIIYSLSMHLLPRENNHRVISKSIPLDLRPGGHMSSRLHETADPASSHRSLLLRLHSVGVLVPVTPERPFLLDLVPVEGRLLVE